MIAIPRRWMQIYLPQVTVCLTILVSLAAVVADGSLPRRSCSDSSICTCPIDDSKRHGLVLKRHAGVHLENLLQVSDRIWSGGEPGGEAAFGELAQLGIRTIISVDSARPSVEAARKAGLTYIHIPIRYDGIDRNSQLMIVRALRESDDAIFIHCHHGVHRGPAAAAVACIADHAVTADQARKVLEAAETSPDYTGLWDAVASFVPPADGTNLPDLSAAADVEPLAETMARVDRLWTRIQGPTEVDPCKTTNDVTAGIRRDVLLIAEEFQELARTPHSGYDTRFQDLLQETATTASIASREEISAATRSSYLQQIGVRCGECHQRYRDGAN